jgi:[ribosomal protein S5]-alanine N-acetyltransferase
MSTPDILTPRLRLVNITVERMRADPARSTRLADSTHFPNSTRFSELLDAHVPPSWPPEHWEPHVFDFMEKQYAQHPHTVGWNRYVILRSGSILIGTLGAFQRSESEAEIGYSILPSWQRMGLATEATLAHIRYLFETTSLQTLIAHTFPHLTPSIRVMEKCGFQLDGPGDEAGTVRYRLRRP